ncbi:hypothetical protein BOSP111201_05610 [Bordetella sputigena]|uniref:hypothetical protein n=1 Tax=Bordetella sputigena TaxID=1416810 RepID=UPI0039F0E8DF
MSETRDQEVAAALSRGRLVWMKENPKEVHAAQNRFTLDEADALGTDHSQLVELEISNAIQSDADRHGIDVNEMLLQLGAGSNAEFMRLRAKVAAQVSRILGTD